MKIGLIESFEQLVGNVCKFEALECLELDVEELDENMFNSVVSNQIDQENYKNIQDAPEEFWDNFPNLKSLKIFSGYRFISPFFEFMDKISVKCPQLEKFHYFGMNVPDLNLKDWGFVPRDINDQIDALEMDDELEMEGDFQAGYCMNMYVFTD